MIAAILKGLLKSPYVIVLYIIKSMYYVISSIIVITGFLIFIILIIPVRFIIINKLLDIGDYKGSREIPWIDPLIYKFASFINF